MYCDTAGVRRCRVLPKSEDVFINGVGIASAVIGIFSHEDHIGEGTGLTPTGEVRLKPVKSTLVTLPWRPTHSLALSEFFTHDDKPWFACPRSTLKKTIQFLKERYNCELYAGFEIEFNLFDKENKPFCGVQNYCSSNATDEAAPVLDEMVIHLKAIGVGVIQYHKEGTYGQFELCLDYYPVLESCDKLLLGREAISAVARLHGLQASFLPKSKPMTLANGCHVHISLWRDGKNLFLESQGKYGISKESESFMAGVLKNNEALANFTVPSTNSYERIKPGFWAGALICWGQDNREAPIRLTSQGPKGSANNFEIKMMDHTANPYFSLSAIMIAGMDGLANKLLLPEPTNSDPGLMDDSARQAHNILPMPENPIAAADILEGKKGQIALGEDLFRIIVGLRRSEAIAMKGKSIEEQAKLLLYTF